MQDFRKTLEKTLESVEKEFCPPRASFLAPEQPVLAPEQPVLAPEQPQSLCGQWGPMWAWPPEGSKEASLCGKRPLFGFLVGPKRGLFGEEDFSKGPKGPKRSQGPLNDFRERLKKNTCLSLWKEASLASRGVQRGLSLASREACLASTEACLGLQRGQPGFHRERKASLASRGVQRGLSLWKEASLTSRGAQRGALWPLERPLFLASRERL